MPDVAVVGTGQTKFAARRPDRTLPELMAEAAQTALADAGIAARDLDAVVAGLAPEALQGVAHAEAWSAGEMAAVGRRLMRVQTGGSSGLSALLAAYNHIRSGQADVVMAIGGDRVRESGDSQQVLNKVWDPVFERDLPLVAIATLALSATRYLHRYGATEEDMARAAVKSRSNGTRNPLAHLQREVTVDDV